MDKPMQGVRILEVAQFTFVPAAGAVLADWGADVVKVEHAVHGDAARGLSTLGGVAAGSGSWRPILEHPNRGKRSIGIDLAVESGREVLYELARRSDVFLTNFLPDARHKLRIDLEHIRAINPEIIYVRGSGFGVRGPEAGRGGYDGTAFWSRGGSAAGVTPPDADRPLYMPAGAYGDSMGGMTIAGGIAGALYGRATTGKTSVVDISLLSVGAWATGLSVNLSLLTGEPVRPELGAAGAAVTNPIHGAFRTKDGRWLQFSMLQPGRYWADFCRHVGREDLIDDERFKSAELLMANAAVAAPIVRDIIESRTLAEWADCFEDLEGPWAPHQNSLEVAHDPQLRANGYIRAVTDADGVPREILANPVQFDETPPDIQRGPLFAEHTDEILAELGHDEEARIQLKLEGAVT
jgi:crotonobetainyl-CoA:carnitine CoA-transferase CaiB-like acyl-CoA transferase